VFASDEPVLQSLKAMGPSAIELEISLLSTIPPDSATTTTTNDDDDDDDLIIKFIEFLSYLFSVKRDVDLASAYLGLLLKVYQCHSYIFLLFLIICIFLLIITTISS